MAFKIFVKKKEKVEIYNTTKKIMLCNYIKYLDTNDLKYFTNYYDLGNPQEPDSTLLENNLTIIFSQILEQTKSYEVIERFNNIHKIKKLEIKYNDVTRLIYSLRVHDPALGHDIFEQLIAQLEKWHYRLDRKKEVYAQLDKIERRIKGIKSEINSLKAKLEKGQKGEKNDIEEIIYSVERGLEMNFQIDTEKTSLFKWILMQKELEQKIQRIERENAKRK